MTNKTSNLKRQAIKARSQARYELLQLLYQWQLQDDSPEYVRRNSFENNARQDIDSFYFDEAWHYITAHSVKLGELFLPFLQRRPFSALDPIERAILWIAAFELTRRKDIHPTVIINEAVELAKKFGADESYKFINGILDKLSKNLPEEVSTEVSVSPQSSQTAE